MMDQSSRYTTLNSSVESAVNASGVVCRGLGLLITRLKSKANNSVLCVYLFFCLCGAVGVYSPGALAESSKQAESVYTSAYSFQHFDIPRQRADGALTALGQQADITVIYRLDWVTPFYTNAVLGEYTLPQAVEKLLINTGLTARFDPQGHLIISQIRDGESRMNSKKQMFAALTALFVGSGTSVSALGQEVSAAGGNRGLDEIIVTAQKREQNLQDVALAVTALSGDKLQLSGVDSALDLQFVVPGLSIGDTPFGPVKATIRGVGAANVFPGGDPGVPIHVNGHYFQSTAYLLRDFLDIERVEVLRGPQGTLYGRNAVGGNINVMTKRPTEEFEGLIGVDVGNYNKRLVQAVLSGSISERVKARLVVSDEVRDGFTENVSNSGEQDLENSDYTSSRISVDYDLSDDVQVFLNGYHYRDTGNAVVSHIITPYPVGAIPGLPNYFDLNDAGENIAVNNPRKISTGIDLSQSEEAEGVSVDVDWNLGSIILRSLTAYNKDDISIITDFGGSDVVLARENDQTSYETYTQELQLLSNTNDRASWILGLFYYDEKSSYYAPLILDNFFTVGGPLSEYVVGPANVTSESVGAFGQVDFEVSEKIELIAGLRYNKDKKSMFSVVFSPDFGLVNSEGGPLVQTDDNDDWTKINGKLGINYHVSDDVMIYGSYSTGYKSGGFNINQSEAYKPEEVKAFELGLKSQWFDNKIETNVSAFHYDYTDKQELRRDAVVLEMLNAGSATVKGMEVESKIRLADALSIDLSVSYMDATYDEFDTLDQTAPELGVQNLAGRTLPNAPEIKFYLGLQYEWDLADQGSILARVDSSWVDDQYAAVFNTNRYLIESYHRTNARIKWSSDDELWQADIYVNNLENDDIFSYIGDGSGLHLFPRSVQYLAPRTYGIHLTRSF